MSNIITQVTLDAVTRKKDRSITLRFVTQLEQTPEQLMEMDRLLNDSGVIHFKSGGNLTKEEVDALEGVEIEVEGKTKSQRLRSVLYLHHKSLSESLADEPKGKPIISFNDFYATEMEKIIEHYKSKLPER